MIENKNSVLSLFLEEVNRLVADGSLGAAEALLNGERNPAPGHPNVQMNRGIIHQHQGQYEQALKIYDEILQSTPGAPDPLYNKAITFLQLKDFEGAVICFNAFLGLTPNNPEALHYRGHAKLELQQYAEATEDLIRSDELKIPNTNQFSSKGQCTKSVK